MRNDVYVRAVLDKTDALLRAGVWTRKLRPHAWLHNFDAVDVPVAAYLLDQFCFYSSDATERLLAATFSAMAHGPWATPAAVHAQVDHRQAFVTRVEGEHPNPTDSGNLLCRLARQVLRLAEPQIVEPAVALAKAQIGHPVVFVDDFVGSGQQFRHTMGRDYGGTTFARVWKAGTTRLYYAALVATSYGLSEIEKIYNIPIFVAHKLDESYNLAHLAFRNATPDPMQAAAIEPLLQKYAPRLRPKENYMQSLESRTYGFYNRGLAFAFEHSVPDATLPIFWAPADGVWSPLLERV